MCNSYRNWFFFSKRDTKKRCLFFRFNSIRTRRHAACRAAPPKRRLRRMKRGGAGAAVETGVPAGARHVSGAARGDFKSFCPWHVGAKRTLLRVIFLSATGNNPYARFLLLLFCKISYSAHLFGPKRPSNGSLSLPTFCEFERSTPTAEKPKKSFSCTSHIFRNNLSYP